MTWQATKKVALSMANWGASVAPAFGIDPTGQCACRNPYCQKPGKHPCLQESPSFGTKNPNEIEKLWRMYPQANLMVHTGSLSHLLVVDVDKRANGLSWVDSLRAKASPWLDTFSVASGGGGIHYYYRYSGNDVASGVDVIRPGVDVRSIDGYVIGAGSRHASGCFYTQLNNDVRAIKEVPKDLLRLIFEKQKLRHMNTQIINVGNGTSAEQVLSTDLVSILDAVGSTQIKQVTRN